MTLTQLEYIVAIAREKNFHRAARACNVTQPTLSALVKKLEDELEVTLFDRSKSPTALTHIGSLIVEQAKTALIESQRIFEILNHEKKDVQGELRIGIIPTVSTFLLPLFLNLFKKKYNLVRLTLSELTTKHCLEALNNESIDVAVLATTEDSKNYFQTELYQEKMLLFTNPNHKLAGKKSVNLKDIRAEEMWLLEEGHCLRDDIINICHLQKVEQKRPLDIDIKVGTLESLRYLVLENFGYTLLPELSTLRLPAMEKKLIRKFKAPEPFRTIQLTTRRKYLKKRLINRLGEVIQEAVGSKLSI